jgi:hypothetical protein
MAVVDMLSRPVAILIGVLVEIILGLVHKPTMLDFSVINQ